MKAQVVQEEFPSQDLLLTAASLVKDLYLPLPSPVADHPTSTELSRQDSLAWATSQASLLPDSPPSSVSPKQLRMRAVYLAVLVQWLAHQVLQVDLAAVYRWAVAVVVVLIEAVVVDHAGPKVVHLLLLRQSPLAILYHLR